MLKFKCWVDYKFKRALARFEKWASVYWAWGITFSLWSLLCDVSGGVSLKDAIYLHYRKCSIVYIWDVTNSRKYNFSTSAASSLVLLCLICLLKVTQILSGHESHAAKMPKNTVIKCLVTKTAFGSGLYLKPVCWVGDRKSRHKGDPSRQWRGCDRCWREQGAAAVQPGTSGETHTRWPFAPLLDFWQSQPRDWTTGSVSRAAPGLRWFSPQCS